VYLHFIFFTVKLFFSVDDPEIFVNVIEISHDCEFSIIGILYSLREISTYNHTVPTDAYFGTGYCHCSFIKTGSITKIKQQRYTTQWLQLLTIFWKPLVMARK